LLFLKQPLPPAGGSFESNSPSGGSDITHVLIHSCCPCSPKAVIWGVGALTDAGGQKW